MVLNCSALERVLFLDITQQEVPFPRRDSNIPAGWEPYDLARELNSTATLQRKALGGLCDSSGVDDEPAGMDFFG